MKALKILALLILVALGLLLVVGFDNVFALVRSRVALALLLVPIFLLFLWCIYKAFQPPRLQERQVRDRKSV
jgi:uncharacterized membrane protein YqjE